jgi:hypothetical protein
MYDDVPGTLARTVFYGVPELKRYLLLVCLYLVVQAWGTTYPLVLEDYLGWQLPTRLCLRQKTICSTDQ